MTSEFTNVCKRKPVCFSQSFDLLFFAEQLQRVLNIFLSFFLSQSVHVFCGESGVSGKTLYCPVQAYGFVFWPQCSCRYISNAGHHALPWSILHLSDQVWQRGARVLHAGKWASDCITDACCKTLTLLFKSLGSTIFLRKKLLLSSKDAFI